MTDQSDAPDKAAWTPFERTGQTVSCPDLPDGTVWANGRYLVVVRHCGESPVLGPLVWLSIKSVANDAIHDWRHFQRIKNELVGPEAEGVELYPAESRLVDTSNQFHLWCFPSFRMPFGFAERLVAEGAEGAVQRPFPPGSVPPDLAEIVLADGPGAGDTGV